MAARLTKDVDVAFETYGLLCPDLELVEQAIGITSYQAFELPK